MIEFETYKVQTRADEVEKLMNMAVTLGAENNIALFNEIAGLVYNSAYFMVDVNK